MSRRASVESENSNGVLWVLQVFVSTPGEVDNALRYFTEPFKCTLQLGLSCS